MEKSRFRNIITILDNAMPEVFLDKVMKGTRYLSIYVEEKYQIKTLLKPFLCKDSSLWNRKKGKIFRAFDLLFDENVFYSFVAINKLDLTLQVYSLIVTCERSENNKNR